MKAHYINGQFTFGRATATIRVDDPATCEILDEVPLGTAQDVDDAVQAAKRAFESWKRISASERAELLHEVSRRIRAHKEELVELLTREEGKPLPENEEEVVWTYNTFDYYAELGRHLRGRVIPSTEDGVLNFVIKEPYGVVGCIVPWNYPLLLLAWKVAPALAAGNTVVIKPSEMTPLTTLQLCEIAFGHLPPGVVNVVTGDGTTGEALVRHPDVPMIAFTGSLSTGQKIASIAAPMMKKTHFELGGKDAFVVCDDADPELAARVVAYAALINAGQVCTSTERVYVPQTMAHRFTDAVVDFVRSLNLGHGLDPNTDMGPMIGDRYRQKVVDHVRDALARGARVLTGGNIPNRPGYFYEPTVLVDVNHSMKVMTEETFGPVIPIMTYRDFDEAIRLTNDSIYGLGACLYTSDAKKVRRFFEDVKAGTIWINDPLTDNYAGPFGGMKYTGGGRELGEEGLEEFRETKHVHWDIEARPKPWWLPYHKNA
ncbi:MAG: aldehyde dehydrogenase family protein [Thermoflexales bacterium]|nr:aldehyde dehydrogenase family protein [Thermoflexales bacterium]MDW8054075.1 aldehyde dehydrogenase family protein [Anaerolineae bacterium]MDW8292590.1 aldehyde dehydrogenase family protein [Anaerolineae bacterium]